MAPAVLHLLPVLRLTGGRRLLSRWRQDPVPRMQQQPIERVARRRLQTFTLRHSILRTPMLLPKSLRQAKERTIGKTLPLRFVSTRRDQLRPQSVFRFSYMSNHTFTVFKGSILLTLVSPLFSASCKDTGCWLSCEKSLTLCRTSNAGFVVTHLEDKPVSCCFPL